MACSPPVQTVTLLDHKTLFTLGGSAPGVNSLLLGSVSLIVDFNLKT